MSAELAPGSAEWLLSRAEIYPLLRPGLCAAANEIRRLPGLNLMLDASEREGIERQKDIDTLRTHLATQRELIALKIDEEQRARNELNTARARIAELEAQLAASERRCLSLAKCGVDALANPTETITGKLVRAGLFCVASQRQDDWAENFVGLCIEMTEDELRAVKYLPMYERVTVRMEAP